MRLPVAIVIMLLACSPARAEFGEAEAREVIRQGAASYGRRGLLLSINPPFKVGNGGDYLAEPKFLKAIDETTSLVEEEYRVGGVNVNGGESTPIRYQSQIFILKGAPNKNEATGVPFTFTRGKTFTAAITGVEEFEGQKYMVMEPFDYKPYLKPGKAKPKAKPKK